MADRTFKFYGQAFSSTGTVNINVTFNGIKIYSGSVAADNSSAEPTQPTDLTQVICEYVGSTDLVGNIPFELQVSNGTVFFGKVAANYSGIQTERLDSGAVSVIVPPENFWSDVNRNSIETDGKINVKINGVAQVRDLLDPTQIGDWWYLISQNKTFTCDIFVDPDAVMTAVPE